MENFKIYGVKIAEKIHLRVKNLNAVLVSVIYGITEALSFIYFNSELAVKLFKSRKKCRLPQIQD